MSDLEQRLRNAFQRARYEGDDPYNPDGDLFVAAADRLRQYREENERLRKALNDLTFRCGDYGHMSDAEISWEGKAHPGSRLEAEIDARTALKETTDVD